MENAKQQRTKPERWMKFLNETIKNPVEIAQLQEFMGYCFVGENIFQKALVVFGDCATGKSLFINIFKQIMGKGNYTFFDLKDFDNPFLMCALQKKELNISSDLNMKDLLSGKWNSIIASDQIVARDMNGEYFSFKPIFKQVFITQGSPVLDPDSGTYPSRLLPIQFKRQFKEDADPSLQSKLEEELSLIQNWVMYGFNRLVKSMQFTEHGQCQ